MTIHAGPAGRVRTTPGRHRHRIDLLEYTVNSNPTPDLCPNCQHPRHLPGTECQTPVNHGPNRFHLCLCLARPGAALACPPQMTCQGGTLGYADVWYLQQGHSLTSADGVISPEVLGPVAVGFPSGGDVEPAVPSVSAVDQTTRDRIADVAKPFFMNFSDEEAAKVNAGELADALAAVLPPTADRGAVLALVDRLIEHCPDHGCVEPEWEDGCHCEIVPLLRRLADEAQQPEAHSCRNCEGVDPSTCLMNPDRPRSDGLKRAHVALAEQAGRDQSALDRVERLALTFEVSGNEFIAQQIRAAVGARQPDTQTHVYLSTGCLHGDEPFANGLTGHEYCQSSHGLLGVKQPGRCKGETCRAACVCPCHAAMPGRSAATDTHEETGRG